MIPDAKIRIPALLGRVRVHHAFLLAVLAGVVCFPSIGRHWFARESPTASVATVVPAATRIPWKEVTGTFSRHQTVADVLDQYSVGAAQVDALVRSVRPVYDLHRVKAGRSFSILFAPDGSLRTFRYDLDKEKYLTVYQSDNEYLAAVKARRFDTRIEPVGGTIEGSLFSAVYSIGETDQLALNLADIFMWEIDFYTEIRKGDCFRALIEKQYLEGSFVQYGSVRAASITNQGRTYTAYLFEDEGDVLGYFDPEGRSLKKSFLKSPLKFGRITSRFSYSRYHPILKIRRPHLGVDYGAPVGTPVVSVGKGIVEFAGRERGAGNVVKVRHRDNYRTFYLHLSRMKVRRGQKVDQGEVLGYVGATGLATGPHLDFRVKKHGKYLNPSKVVYPPSPPVPSDSLERFVSVRDSLQGELEKITF